jgi:hypothetical protein
MYKELNTLFLFVFVFSCVYVLNLCVRVVVSALRTPPQQLEYNRVEKILNYFSFTYIITYLIEII